MPEYIIPITYMITADIGIRADSLEEAIDIAVNGPLPMGDYLDESIRIQSAVIGELNPEITDKEIEEVYKKFNQEYWFED